MVNRCFASDVPDASRPDSFLQICRRAGFQASRADPVWLPHGSTATLSSAAGQITIRRIAQAVDGELRLGPEIAAHLIDASAVAGQVVVRPMINLALCYYHRFVDGREAVLFLRRIKEVGLASVWMRVEF